MIQRARLLRLVRILERIAERPRRRRSFNLNVWRGRLGSMCGTAACAVGEATMDRQFRAEGFGWCRSSGIPIFQPSPRSYATWNGWQAVEEFFGVTPEIAFWLFAPTEYEFHTNPRLVAARINRLLFCSR